jgi:hypothetical protein
VVGLEVRVAAASIGIVRARVWFCGIGVPVRLGGSALGAVEVLCSADGEAGGCADERILVFL